MLEPPSDSATPVAFVISVPASAPLVGVQERDAADPDLPRTLSFPVRTQDGTRSMEFSEVMERANATRRARYLSVLEVAICKPGEQTVVRLSVPASCQGLAGGGHRDLPYRDASRSPWLGSVDERAIEVSMPGWGFSHEYGVPVQVGANRIAVEQMKIPAGEPLVLPHELVRAVWSLRDGTICIATQGHPVWEFAGEDRDLAGAWRLIVGGVWG